MTKSNEQRTAEEATGCVQIGRLVYLNEKGIILNEEQAAQIFQSYGLIGVPGAGAGNYREVFVVLGVDVIEVNDWTSSAGDWSFGVKIYDKWYMATQENRYPCIGFKYLLSDLIGPCKTKEELFERAAEI